MTTYRYRAVRGDASAEGAGARTLVGEWNADSGVAARAALRRKGLIVLRMQPVAESKSSSRSGLAERWSASLRSRRANLRTDLFDGMATLLRSGVPLVQTLETLRQSSNLPPRLHGMLERTLESVRGGESLAASWNAHPHWFGPIDTARVAAAEASGSLPEMLSDLAQEELRRHQLQAKIVGALTYPALVATAGLGVVVFLSQKTLPEFARMLRDASIEPPKLTLAVIGVGNFVSRWGWLVAFMLLAAVLGFPALQAIGRRRWGWTGQRVVGWFPRFWRQAQVAAFSRATSQLLRAGVPLVEALRIVAPTLPSLSLRGEVEEGAERIEQGESLAAAVRAPEWFSSEYRQLLEVAEASGEVDAVLLRLAERYERQAQRFLERFSAVLEPAFLLVLATLIGFVVMAAVLPLLKMQEMV